MVSTTDPTLPRLTSAQRIQVAAKAYVLPRTVLRCYKSLPVHESTAVRIIQAARELRFPEPRVTLTGGRTL